MTKSLTIIGVALCLSGAPFANAADDSKYIEEVVVTGERGATNTLDRAMTVTGFNQKMIQELGIKNTSDLEVLVPGMQIGPRSQGGGKNEDGHIVMRGVANDRSVNFYQDVSVAVYIDGVYSDQSYGLDQGAMFDVERVEISRGPQGTTGGKAAIAGSISFVTKKPTDEFDLKASLEVTDQSTQQLNLAFGGPIGESPFSYRLGLGRMVGDALIENVGSGPDAGKPDQLIYSPQLRFKNDRWDVTARFSKLQDKGVHNVSLVLGARNSTAEFLTDAFGNRQFVNDPGTGLPIYLLNPSFGLGQNPAVANCPQLRNDGTREPGARVVCDGEDIQQKIEGNAPIFQESSQEAYTLEAHYALNDGMELIYKYGNRDTRTNNNNDSDNTNRQGGGICSAIHPRVLSGELTKGQVSPRCALDGAGNGAYADSIANYLFTSAQDSHELTLVSKHDGPLNYTVGFTYINGEEPYVFRDIFNGVGTGNNNLNNAALYEDSVARCEAAIAGMYGPNGTRNVGGTNKLWRDIFTNVDANKNAVVAVYGCYGAPHIVNFSDVSNGHAFEVGSGTNSAFFSNLSYVSKSVYGNAEYVLNNQWKLSGGLRYNNDHKERDQVTSASSFQLPDPNNAGKTINLVSGVFRAKYINAACCGYAGTDGRTLADSKVHTWSEVTWNIGAEYSPVDNRMWYGRISHGYRPGGFGGFNNGLGEAWDAESMINYEVGLKGLFFDSAVQMELSAYFQDFSAYWIQASRLRTPEERRTGQSLYIGESHAVDGTEIAGLELQGAWRISDRLVLRGFAEYMYSSFGDYFTSYCCTPDGTAAPTAPLQVEGPDGTTITVNAIAPVNFGGNSLRNQPQYKFSSSLAYEVPVASSLGSLNVVTIMSWRDQMYVDEANLDIYSVPAYTRWDLRANWRSPTGHYTVTGWVTNMLDEIAVQSYSPREGNGVTAPINGTVTDGRRIGVTVNYQL